LYRIVKLDAAAFFCARKEHIVNNEGRGGNGKSLHQYLMLQMFGQYSNVIARKLLQQGPPAPGSPCPELVCLRGVRMLFTPEAEQGKPLSPALLKDIRDPSTLWRARDLYESGKVAFHIPALLDINSNDFIDITTIDGGVRRSLRAVPWAKDLSGSEEVDLRTGTVEEALRRNAVQHERVQKDAATVQPWRTGMLKIWIAAWNVWFKDLSSPYIEPTPAAVREQTEQVLAGGAHGNEGRKFVEALVPAVSPGDAATLHELVESLSVKLERYGMTDKKRMRALLRLWLVELPDGRVARVGSTLRLAVPNAV
jgi:hypothetical protein